MRTIRFAVACCSFMAACGAPEEFDSGMKPLPLPTSNVASQAPAITWAAEYYATTNLAGRAVRRSESAIDFDYGAGSPDPSIGDDGFSARFTGVIEATTTATYDFSTVSDDGIRVIVDGVTLIDEWNDHGATRFDASLSLAAGSHRVSVEYYESWGDALVRVSITRQSDCMPPTSTDPIEPPDGTATAYNILIRGQSNALLFVDWGGAWAMRSSVAAELGVGEDAIHVIADWAHPRGHNTINSGTGFIRDWMDGESARDLESGLLNAIADMSEQQRANPTLILWIHNEYDQQHEGLTEATWLTSARADGRLVRSALGQPAARTPYFYVWVPYGYASPGAPEAVRGGMDTLVNDESFNGHWGTDIQQSDMGDPSHMSDDGSDAIGRRIAPEIAAILRNL